MRINHSFTMISGVSGARRKKLGRTPNRPATRFSRSDAAFPTDSPPFEEHERTPDDTGRLYDLGASTNRAGALPYAILMMTRCPEKDFRCKTESLNSVTLQKLATRDVKTTAPSLPPSRRAVFDIKQSCVRDTTLLFTAMATGETLFAQP